MKQQSCAWGYTDEDLHEMLGESRYQALRDWMYGQTMVLCDGREYDHEAKAYKPSACAGQAHGPVVFTWDVEQFLAGGEALD